MRFHHHHSRIQHSLELVLHRNRRRKELELRNRRHMVQELVLRIRRHMILELVLRIRRRIRRHSFRHGYQFVREDDLASLERH